MHHPLYCLAQHLGIPTNITISTHFSVSLTLVHHPTYPYRHATPATHANTLPSPTTPPPLSHHPLNLATHPGMNSTPFLQLFSNVYQTVTENFLKETLSSRNLSIKNLGLDNNVHEEISPCETYLQKFAPTFAELFNSTLSILPKCAFSKKRVKKFNSSVLVSNFTVSVNLTCDLPLSLHLRNT